MARGGAWRCLHAFGVLLGVSLATFAAAHAAGDPAPQPGGRALIAQYLLFLRHAVQGDLGQSLIYRQPVAATVLQHVPATFLLAGSAFAIAIGVSLPLGVEAASRGGWAACLLRMFARIGMGVPPFWLGLMFLVVICLRWRLLPLDGYSGIAHPLLPVIALASPSIARMSRHIDAAMHEILRADYMRTARAKGLLERRVTWVHGVRNLLVPAASLAVAELCELVSSAVAMEVVFAWPGIGRLAVTAVRQHDMPLLQGIVLMAGAFFVVIHLVAGIAFARIDPVGGVA